MSTTTDTVVKEAEVEVKDLADRDADSVNSNIRYMAYGSRLRTALVASTRYVAYVGLLVLQRLWIECVKYRPAMLARRSDLSYILVLSLPRE